MHDQRILITGGLGQVGSYICEELVRAGNLVTVLDNNSSNVDRQFPDSTDDVKYIKDDIRDIDVVNDIVKNNDAIIHCAAQISVAYSVQDPLFDAGNNILGTLNLLNAARSFDVRKFIYFSSAAIFGDPVYLPVNEQHPLNPMSPYGVSKMSGEKYAMAFNAVYGLPATVIRPFNIYSPRQDPSNPYSGVISKFIDNVRNGKPPVIFGDGSATRDFVSVHDVVDMVMLMLEKDEAEGKVFNCGTGQSTRIDELAQMVIDLYGRDGMKPEFRPERPGDIKYSYADISMARKALGYEPKVSLRDGLQEIIDSKKNT